MQHFNLDPIKTDLFSFSIKITSNSRFASQNPETIYGHNFTLHVTYSLYFNGIPQNLMTLSMWQSLLVHMTNCTRIKY